MLSTQNLQLESSQEHEVIFFLSSRLKKNVLSDVQKKEDMHINPIKTTFSIPRYNNLLNPNHP